MKSDIQEIIEKGENERVELHGPRTNVPTLARTVCGMLNQQGGVVIVGVLENGQVVGIDDSKMLVDELHECIATDFSPLPLVSAASHEVNGKQVIVVDVPPGADKPYSVNRTIFVRVGKQTLKADASQTSSIVQKAASQFDRWECEPLPGFEIVDCDSKELIDARAEIVDAGRLGVNVPIDSLDLLRRLHLSRSGQLTNAAAVMFARDPLDWSPNLAIRIVSFSTEKMGDIANDSLIHGPAVQCLRNAISTIQQRTGYTGRFLRSELERKDTPAYALYALREGLVNAITHRDYTAVGGQIRVEIYKDRLSIQNPGRLPEGWKPADLKNKHGSVPFNPDIARIFYLRGLMEQLGIGTQKLVAECKALKAASPKWDASQNMVTLTLFAAPEPEAKINLNERQEQFLTSIEVGKPYKSRDYAALTGVVDRQARRELVELVMLGLLLRTGSGPATVYERTDKQL
jgi:ATP-dependent DNA helicase RecG